MNDIVIDICGTLYHSNTTFDFLYWKFKGNNRYEFFFSLYHSLPWRVLSKILWEMFHYDLTRVLAVRFLKGISKDQLMLDAEIFYRNFLQKHKNQEVFDTLNELRKSADNKLTLASATLDFIAEIVAKHEEISLGVSTLLKYTNGICSGKIQNDMLGRKLDELNNCLPLWMCITDDISDIPLIQNSINHIVVVYPKNKSKWDKVIQYYGLCPKVITIDKNFYS